MCLSPPKRCRFGFAKPAPIPQRKEAFACAKALDLTMKKIMKIVSLLLCLAMLTSTFSGCGFLFGGGDEPEDEFNPPYLENYYVNKHEPVVVSGGI